MTERREIMLLADEAQGDVRGDLPAIRVRGMSAAEGATRGLTRIAGGVMFDTPSDQPSTARARGRGRAVAESRSPTAKPLPKSQPQKRRGRVRSLLE